MEKYKHLGGSRYAIQSFTDPELWYECDLEELWCNCPSRELPDKHVRWLLGEVSDDAPEEEVELATVPFLFTQRFQDFHENMGKAVRITLGAPRFKLSYDYDFIPELAPPAAVFRLKEDSDFVFQYRKHLDRLGPARIAEYFREAAERTGSDTLVLLCYENVHQGQLCHRRTFADWWREKTGITIPELDPADYGKVEKGTDEGRLF